MSQWAGLALGGLGSLLGGGGWGQGRDKIGPYNKYTVRDSSQGANLFAEKTLADYMRQIGGVTANAGRTGQDIWKMYLQQSAGLNNGLAANSANAQALARSTTGELKGIYNDYGRESEQVAKTQLQQALANADSQIAARRIRGGSNTANQMLGAGMRGLAQNDYIASTAGIKQARADRMAGAVSQGRGQELATQQAYQQMRNAMGAQMLGMGMDARQRAFELPNQMRVNALNQWLQMKHRPEYMYPNENMTANILGGNYSPVQTENPIGGLADFMTGMGGRMYANYLWGMNPQNKMPPGGIAG